MWARKRRTAGEEYSSGASGSQTEGGGSIEGSATANKTVKRTRKLNAQFSVVRKAPALTGVAPVVVVASREVRAEGLTAEQKLLVLQRRVAEADHGCERLVGL